MKMNVMRKMVALVMVCVISLTGMIAVAAANYDCAYCQDTGLCPYCDGVGRDLCYCLGGNCSGCNGSMYYMVFTSRGIDYRPCNTCGGTGNHAYCNGTGWLTCAACYGYGLCPYCS